MSRYTLEEEEQLASLKAFWSKYGNFILTVLIVGFGAFAIHNGWLWWQAKQAAKGVVVFEQLENAIDQKNFQLVKKLEQVLVDDHGHSPYAERGALIAAKAMYDSGDKGTSKTELGWAVEHSDLTEYEATARLMLSGILIDEGKFEEARSLVEHKDLIGFEGLFQDRIGDIAFAQKKYADARVAYEDALKKLQPTSPWIEVVQRKLSALPKTGE